MFEAPYVSGPPDPTEHCGECDDDDPDALTCDPYMPGLCDCDCTGCRNARKAEARADYEDGRANYEMDTMKERDDDE